MATQSRAQNRLARLDRQLEQIRRDEILRIDPQIPTDRRALLDYGAFITTSYLSIDDQLDDNHVLRQYDIVGYARANFDGVHEIFLRGRTGYRDFNDQDSFDGRGDELIDGDFDRAFYRFDLRRALEAYKGRETDADLVIEAGRDLVYWGNGLAISEVIDGAFVRFTSTPINIDVIAGVTPVRTLDIDTSRPNFDHNTRRGFYGIMLSRQIKAHRPFAYAIIQRDYNQDRSLDFPDQNIHTRFEYNSYYLGLGSSGALTDRLLYGVELTYEGGYGLSNSYQISPDTGLVGVPQTDEPVNAFAGDVRLDYLFGDDHQTRASAEAIIASGDPDRLTSSTDTFGGNRPGTGDNAFSAFGFLNTGVAFAPAVSNLMALRLGVSTLPLPNVPYLERFQIGSDALIFAKTQRDAPIDEPTQRDRRYLGWEPDFFVNWQMMTDVTIALRYGIFFPGEAIQNDDRNRQFFYAGVTYAF